VTKIELPLGTAERVAERLRNPLVTKAGAFSRVEIAGSVRRRKPLVGDIELVAEIDPDLEFGASGRIQITLNGLGVRRAAPTVRKDGVSVKAPWGPRYWKATYEYEPGRHVQLDLFVVSPPAEWGVIYLIRTGGDWFSQKMVDRLHRYGLKSQDGRIVHTGREGTQGYVACPTEERFFELAHMPFVPPERRTVDDPDTVRAFTEGTT
jgi:DNA polymerase/3'-5' exonuclease PolX